MPRRPHRSVQPPIQFAEPRVLLSASAPATLSAPDPTELAAAAWPTVQQAPFNLADTFVLHSRPTATKVIFLDFDGHTTTGTLWNSQYNNNQPIVTTAYSFDANPAFSASEETSIQQIWQRVAEDYSPFDVDVTTEQPPVEDLMNSGGGDTRWGIRAIIGSTFAAFASAGGVSYVGDFSWDSDTPAFIFEDNLGNGNEKLCSEAASHEVGHSLGLNHDGRTSPVEEYYGGHGSGATSWAPIMGVGYSRELSQWSKGEYLNANNHEDDLSKITSQNGFGYRADDYANASGLAGAIAGAASGNVFSVDQSGVIEQRTDVDVFKLASVGTGSTIQLNAVGGPRGGNLDISLELLDAGGSVVASDNPTDDVTAAISYTSTAGGTYYVRIDGVGVGDPLATGYTDYATLGQYQITGGYSISTATSDIVLNSVTTDNFTQLTVQYTVSGTPVTPFGVGAYRSADTQFDAGDVFVSAAQITAASDLAAGVHTKTFSIGSSILLPGAGAADVASDYRLLFVADNTNAVDETDANPFNDDNTLAFSGAYHFTNSPVMAFGSANADTISVTNLESSLRLTMTGIQAATYATSGIPEFRLRGGPGNDSIAGGTVPKPFSLWGGDGNDALTGGTGTDTLTGGAGNDSLSGQAGNDLYVFGAAVGTETDTAVEAASAGTDTLGFGNLASSVGVWVNLAGTGTTLAIHAGRTILAGAAGQQANWENANGGAGNDTLIGNSLANAFVGNGGNDNLVGNLGNDTLTGSGGKDTLNGGAGNDSLAGGAGDDLYVFAAPVSVESDTAVELSGGGTDTLGFGNLPSNLPVSVNLAATGTTLAILSGRTVSTSASGQAANWENANGGAGNDTLTGNSLDNSFLGGVGNDTLSGASGNDTLNGGLGLDTLDGGPGTDTALNGEFLNNFP